MKSRVVSLLAFAVIAGLSPLVACAQSPVLLNIWTYAGTPTAVSNYQAAGVAGLTGSEPISQFYQPAQPTLVSPLTFTNGGQVLYLSDTTGVGTWAKNTGAGPTNGLMGCYLYITNSTVRTMTVSNLNLTPGTNYTLYVIGTIPASGTAEDGLFQPVNTPNLTFTSTASARGALVAPFTTSADYSNTDVLRFTWAKASSGNGSFQGLAIVPGVSFQTESLTITNGVQKYAALANTTVTMTGRCELWVNNSLCPLSDCIINLNSADAWLFLPGVKPSFAALSTYLRQVRINGAAAVADSNCRVVEYGQTGAVVIPHASNFQPLTVFSGNQFTGTATPYSQWTYYTGSGIANISSFKLKRGYQVVFAQSSNGANYSKCYTAQDGDLEVGVLPAALDKQVQFIYVTPWRWTSKKGSCDIAPVDLGATWWYNWNISANSTRDLEYVAIRQQPYWPSLSQNWQTRGVNQVSGYNEPNNSSQDAYKNLNPPGSVSDAVARLPDQLATGLRVGAPAVDDGGTSWIINFVNQADAAGYRLDYVPVHYYRSYSNNNYPAGAANNLYNFLKTIYDAVKRPIWVTEFNNGANWTSDPDPTFDQNKNIVEAMINLMDSTPWIERYSVYSAVEEVRQVYYNAGGYTPMGLMYRDHVAPLSHVQAMPDNGTRGIAQFLFATNTWDTSGYYNNGMAMGAPTYSTGHNAQSQAIVLDGANSYVQLPANIAKGNAFTFAAWVYWNGGSQWQRIFDFGDDTSHYLFLTPSSGSTTLRFAIKNGSGEQIVERAGALASGSWQHVAVTLSGSSAILYVNGAQVASSTSFSNAPSAFTPTRNYLGKSQFANDPLFNGKLDSVEIADYALSAAQIAVLYNNALYPTYASGVWTNNASGAWGTSNNWNGGLIANGASRVADFSTVNLGANCTITLDSARTIGGLRFGDTSGSQTWTLTGGNTLTLDGGSPNPAFIAVNQNTATISAPLAGSYGFAKTGAGTLVLTGTNAVGGTLTLGAGTLNLPGGAATFGPGTSYIGYQTGSGNLSLTASSLAIAGELRVGGSDQSGTQYNAKGTATLANATLTVGSLTVARGNYLDNSVSGTVTLNSGSTLISTNDTVVQYAGSGLGKLALNGGTFILGPTATKWLMLGYWDSGAGELAVTNGNVFLENNSSIKLVRGNNNTGSNVVNQVGGGVTFYSDAGVTVGGTGRLDLNYAGGANSSGTYNLRGGTLTVPQIIATSVNGARIFNFNGGTLKAAGNNASFLAAGVASAANVRNFGAFIDTAGFSVTIGQALIHSTVAGDSAIDGGLSKLGSGTLTLTGVNTYTGPTTINAGTLVLGGGSIGNSPTVTIAAGAVFDVSAAGYTQSAAQTLRGSGTVNGTANLNGTLSPGIGSLGVLTFSVSPVLNGTAVMELNRTNALNSDRLVVNSGTLNYGGILTVANAGPALQAGDSFQLFSASARSGAFTATNLPSIGTGLGWTFNPASGVLSVVQTVATNPTNLLFSADGTNLALSWPADHTGWKLQAQTNSPGAGLGPNWFDVPGSDATNSMTLPMDLNIGSVFYRLVFP